MGRAPCCDKSIVKRGPWAPEEDITLKNYLESHGTGGNWIALPQKAGLRRCGKSCRLRWLNYLRPDIKHGGFTEEEDNIICSLYITIGSRWSVIAAKLPGRTDNDVKNYWNTKLKKKFMAGKITPSSSVLLPSHPSHHQHQPTSTQSLKLESHHGFSNSSAMALPVSVPMDTDFRQNSNSQTLVSDPIHHHQFSISLPSPANASTSVASSSSYHQEFISSAGVSPSVLQPCLTFENNYSFWLGNEGGIINGTDQDSDGFFMDFGFNPSSYDFLYDLGFQYQEKSISTSTTTEGVVASNSANTSSTLLYANLLAANSTTTDTKPQQGLYQSVRN